MRREEEKEKRREEKEKREEVRRGERREEKKSRRHKNLCRVGQGSRETINHWAAGHRGSEGEKEEGRQAGWQAGRHVGKVCPLTAQY